MNDMINEAHNQGRITFSKTDLIAQGLLNPDNHSRISVALAESTLWRFDRLDTILIRLAVKRSEN